MNLICEPKKRKFSTTFEKHIETESVKSYKITDLTWIKKNDGFSANFEIEGKFRTPGSMSVEMFSPSFGKLKETIVNFVSE